MIICMLICSLDWSIIYQLRLEFTIRKQKNTNLSMAIDSAKIWWATLISTIIWNSFYLITSIQSTIYSYSEKHISAINTHNSLHFSVCSVMYRVVGFEVEPMSVSVSDIKFEGDMCNFPDTPKPQIVSETWDCYIQKSESWVTFIFWIS